MNGGICFHSCFFVLDVLGVLGDVMSYIYLAKNKNDN
jgi:hypothetical protein